jgi:hypothetical protein
VLLLFAPSQISDFLKKSSFSFSLAPSSDPSHSLSHCHNALSPRLLDLFRYFGGDLSIMSMEGYGTDAFLHLSRLGRHDEPLP